MDTNPRHRAALRRRVATTVLASALLLALPGAALAQTAQTLYERAQAREASARAAKSPSVDTLRSTATAYENIVRRYPTSGYTDNALWQAAGLRALAWQISGEATDVDRAIRYLEWLRDEYPHSRLVGDAQSLIRDLRAAARPASPAAVRTSAPAPPRPAAGRAAPTSTPPASAAPARIEGITREAIPRGDRITIALSREVTYTGDRVDGPDRLFFDFAGTLPMEHVDETAGGLGGTMVRSVRVGRHPDQTTRIVLDLRGAPRHSAYLRYDPFRLVIDLEARPAEPPPSPQPFPTPRMTAPPVAPPSATPPASPAVTRTAAAAIERGRSVAIDDAPPAPVALPPPAAVTPTVESPAPTPAMALEPEAPPVTATPVETPEPAESTSRGDYSLARQLGLGVSRIVIDPGHGGHDPGAQANGIVESRVALDIAHRLERLLKTHPGVEVLLTRSDDSFIPLEERTAFANREGADMFLSIHVNSSRTVSTRGVETYVLNFATNEAAEAVAARENATSARSMGNLPDIVKTIALNDKLAESRELATMVQTALVRSLRTQSSGVRDLGVKQAPFVVLIGAQMPSVLAEVSFLSNRAEADLLKNEAYRQRIAEALHDAVVKYQASLKKITTPPSLNESR